MQSVVVVLVMVGALGLAVGTQTWGDQKPEKRKGLVKDKVEMAAAKVTIEQAVRTASEKVHGTVIDAELERNLGKLVWEVEVVTPEKRLLTVHVDADSGRVLDVEEKEVEREKPRERKQVRKREQQP